jgi:hypothetical protein
MDTNCRMRGHALRGGGLKLTNMDAFDRLPKALREALANSDHNWSAYQAYSVLQRPKHKRPAQAQDAKALAQFHQE